MGTGGGGAVSTTNPSHKGVAIGLGVAGGAAALAGIGVGIAHLVGNMMVHTILTAPAAVGETSLAVHDQTKLKIGDKISICYDSQIRKVTGFGSVLLDTPVTIGCGLGGTVKVIPSPDSAMSPGFKARGVGGVEGVSGEEPGGAEAQSSGSSSDPSGWFGRTGSLYSSDSGSLAGLSTGNALSGFLVVFLLCAVLAICGAIVFFLSKRNSKRTGQMDGQGYFGQPQYGFEYQQPQVPAGLQVPPGFGYEVEGQPLMQYQGGGYAYQPQAYTYNQPQSYAPMAQYPQMGYLA